MSMRTITAVALLLAAIAFMAMRIE